MKFITPTERWSDITYEMRQLERRLDYEAHQKDPDKEFIAHLEKKLENIYLERNEQYLFFKLKLIA